MIQVSTQQSIEIEPGMDYHIKFNPETCSFQEIKLQKETEGWSDSVIAAIAKSPTWLHHDLIRQFKHLDNKTPYAKILINASRQITDELAFSIAASPLGHIAEPETLLENVAWLYTIDKNLSYADIIDYYPQNGSYYSTVRYHILQNGSTKTYEFPVDIYYWYIVHPTILGETVQETYDTFWRQFLYTHNDRGYPLLQELIENIQFLWDTEAYSQPSARIWTEWISLHPTAIEASSYWIGKTIPYLATGDRPIQPNVIAHEHNGYCGELQRLAVAVQRSLLIPSIGTCNIAEDHVWREFYDHGWHQNDNWWADKGGTVDKPHVYTDGWGKDMSSIYAVRGDGRIIDRTGMYLHQNETVTVNFSVYDRFNKPYDGAQITALVQGIKDISWYKYKILEFLETIWLNQFTKLHGTVFETWYKNIRHYIIEIDDIVDGPIISTWNYTDMDGFCSFTLGKYDEYFFLIQNPDDTLSWPLRKHTVIRRMKDPQHKSFHIVLNDFSNKPIQHDLEVSNGEHTLFLSSNTTWCQPQQHIRTKDIGIHQMNGDIEIFYVDEQNFQQYQQGHRFTSYQPKNIKRNSETLQFDSPLYIVFVNNAHHSSAIVDFKISMNVSYDESVLSIDSPTSAVFNHPTFNIGDHIEFTGYTSEHADLILPNKTVKITPGRWSYIWNTTDMLTGEYFIQLRNDEKTIEKNVVLIDATPPEIHVSTPKHHQIFHQSDSSLPYSGTIYDTSKITSVEIYIDGLKIDQFSETNQWDININLASLKSGIHRLTCSAIDHAGNMNTHTRDIIVCNETKHEPPEFHSISSTQKRIGNWSSIILHVDVSTIDHYPLQELNVYFHNSSSNIHIKKMYEYASNPILSRHGEDPLYNESNQPIYGCFLGDFYYGDTITYWIEAIDVSGRRNISSAREVTC